MNRLTREKSPYLLQHAENPVHWYAWGPAAFERAKADDKPVLLSIGYSTCHWCHVMAHESFEDEKTAELLNRDFISIKVDREERPDIDAIYMSYVQATTGGGGWPMTVFLTPDKKPFYGGTYFPPEDRYGMPGFKGLLAGLADAWKTRREEILKSADSAVQFLKDRSEAGPDEHAHAHALSEATLANAFAELSKRFDAEQGGFGPAPKFPMGHTLGFLLRYWHRTQDEAALEMAVNTLDAMAAGGLYDQLGGGFHRYSTDRLWRVPHFEKMLYDQAGLVRVHLEAYQATHQERYARIARETLDYVLREMTSPDGGFFSAQDADSADPENPSEKREGAFFVWRKSEIEKLLGAEAGAFCRAYGIEPDGNAVSDPHGELKGFNVLTVADAAAAGPLREARKKLFTARSKRPAPHLDDKVLADWNGLMVGSLAVASRVLNEPRYRDAATRAAEFIWLKMRDKNGRLLHRYRDNDAAIDGTLDDYAFMLQAFLDLYEASFDEKWLSRSKELAASMSTLFWDEKSGGFFMTAADTADLIVRPKNDTDGAVPSGNSAAALGLLRLARFTGDGGWEKKASAAIEASSAGLTHQSTAYTAMLCAFDFALGPTVELTLDAGREDDVFSDMIIEVYKPYLPNKVVLRRQAAGPTAARVCRGRTCERPVNDAAALKKILKGDKK